MKKIIIIILFLNQLINGFSQNVGDYRSILSGNWTSLLTWEQFDGSNWLPVSEYPGQNSVAGNITIGNHNVIVDASPTHPIASLVFEIAATSASVSMNDGTTLSITGDIIFSNPSSNGNQTFNLNNATLNCNSVILASTTSSTETNVFKINNGTLTLESDFVSNGTSGQDSLIFTGSGVINISGTITGNMSFESGTGTVNYTGSSDANIKSYSNYYNLKISGTAVKSLIGTVTVLNDLEITENSVLQNNDADRDLNVIGDIIIQSGAKLQSCPVVTSGQTFTVNIGGNLANDGTINFYNHSGFTSNGNLVFNSTTANQVFDLNPGSKNDFNRISCIKTGQTLLFNVNSDSLTYHDLTGQGFLYTTSLSGTFELGGSANIMNQVFTAADYTIPTGGKFTLNNPNFIVDGQNSNVTIDGELEIITGIMNIGGTSAIDLVMGNGSQLRVSGGTLNIQRCLRYSDPTDIVTFNITGGVVNTGIQTYSSNIYAAFDVNSSSSCTMSGGSIYITQANTNGTKNDYRMLAPNINISGGNLQFGNSSTAGSFTFNARGAAPNLTIDSTTNPKILVLNGDLTIHGNLLIKTATNCNLNGFLLSLTGNLTNRGTLNGSVANSHLSFNGIVEQNYGGGGTLSPNLQNLTFNNVAGVTLNSPLGANTINLINGNVITSSANLLTLYGTSAATSLTGGNQTSFVVGPFRRYFAPGSSATYLFPIGVDGNYRSFEMNGTVTAGTGTGYITAEVFNVSSGGSSGNGLHSPINDEDIYWKIDNALGTVSVSSVSNIQLTYTKPGSPAMVIGQSNNVLAGSYNSIGGTQTGPKVVSDGYSLVGINPSGTAYLIIAQTDPLTGTYTIGSGGNYINLTAVATALSNNVVDGNVVFELLSTYSGEPSFPVLFNSLSLANSTDLVTIRPQSGVTARATSGDPGTDNTSLIIIDGISNLVFDGRAGGAGNSEWTLTNSRGTNPGAVFEFRNGAQSNTLAYLNLRSDVQSLTNGVVNIGTSNGLTGNNNNAIRYCDITGNTTTIMLTGVYSVGTAGLVNTGNIVDNCNIYNFFSATQSPKGVYVGNNNSGWTISNNRFYQSTARTLAASQIYRPIYIDAPTGSGFTVSGNTIGFASSSGTGNTVVSGVTSQFAGIWINAANSTNSTINGNTISNINFTTSYAGNTDCGVFSGIYVQNGNLNIGALGNSNLIGSPTTNDNISLQHASGGLTYGIKVLGTGNITVNYNQVSGITVSGNNTVSDILFFTAIGVDAVNATISENVIGSPTLSHSNKVGTSGVTTTSTSFYGIANAGNGNIDISGNRVANCTAYGTGGAGSMLGIYSDDGRNTINSNQIYNLVAFTSRAGSRENSSICGIRKISTIANQTITRNTIYSLSCENVSTGEDVTISGITFSSNTLVPDVISRNFIHSFSSLIGVTDAIYTGIYQHAGAASIQNNMVRLGFDASGASITAPIAIAGIHNHSNSESSYLYNSVFIGGLNVTTGTLRTSAFLSDIEQECTIGNNLFINRRSSTGGPVGQHYAIMLQSTNLVVSDYNIFLADGTGGTLSRIRGSSTDYLTLQAHRAVLQGQDLHSGIGNPNFVNPTGNAGIVNLHLSGNTPAYRTGILFGGVSFDFDGDARTNDIGADAGNFSMTNAEDIFTPNFSYIPISQKTVLQNAVIYVTITDQAPDGQGIDSLANAPRMYFRRSQSVTSGNIEPDFTTLRYVTGVKQSGNAKNGVWGFTLNWNPGEYNNIASGDIIDYYFVAQDLASPTPNYWYSKFSSTRPTSSQLADNTVPVDFFGIEGNLQGTYTVGTGRDFPTLTGVKGLFQNLSALNVTGNISAIIMDNIVEPGTYGCGQWSEGPGGPFIVTVSTSVATPRNITTTATDDMIRLHGVDRLVIDGSVNGVPGYIAFTQGNSSFSTLSIAGGSNNNIVKNCYIIGRVSSPTKGIITFADVPSGANTGNEISNNLIWNITSMVSNSIYSQGNGGNLNAANRIIGNDIKNFSENGIWITPVGNGNSWTISDNTLYNDFTTSPALEQYGIRIQAGTGHTISGNSIGGTQKTTADSLWINTGNVHFYGIGLYADNSDSCYILNNTIHDIQKTGTGNLNNQFRGIWIERGLVRISGNTINDIVSNADDMTIPIQLGNLTASGSKISGNTISNITTTGNTDFRGIYLDVADNVNRGIIAGNTIRGVNINNTNASVDFYGIKVANGRFDITGNTLGGSNLSDRISFNGGGNLEMITLQDDDWVGDLDNNTITNVLSNSHTNFYGYNFLSTTDNTINIRSNSINNLNLNASGTVNCFNIADGRANLVGNTIGSGTAPVQNTGNAVFDAIRLSTDDNNISLIGNTINTVIVPSQVSLTGIRQSSAITSTMNGNTISNIQMSNAGVNTSFKGIWISAGSSTLGFSSANTIGSENINDIQIAGPSAAGISITNSAAVNAYNNIIENISQSSILNTASIKGIDIESDAIFTATGNTIHSLSTTSTKTYVADSPMASQGIWISGSGARTISSNTIYNINANGSATINVAGINESATDVIISKNKVYGILNSSTNGTASGIVLSELNTGYVANNMISLGADDGAEYSGIWIPNDNASRKNIYYNSIYIGGTATSGNSYAFLRENNQTPVYLRNNIFVNNRTGGSGKHYAIGSRNTELARVDLNYNNYYSANASTLGLWGATDNTFAQWIANTTEANSVNLQPNFMDAVIGNLHLNPANSCALAFLGTTLTEVTDDFDNNARSANPTLGADEVTPTGEYNTWLGNVSTEWDNPLNWQCRILPSTNSNLTIGNVTNDPIINRTLPAATVTINELNILSGGRLELNAGNSLTLTGNLTVDGNMVLHSPNGNGPSATLIDNGTITGTGNIQVERYLTGAAYHYVSSPIQGGGNASSSLFGLNFYRYNEALDLDNNPLTSPAYDINNLVAGWVMLGSGVNMDISHGYASYNTANRMIIFNGLTNTGNQNVSGLSYSDNDPTALPNTTLYDGWHLVGNPYPSYLDWDLVAGVDSINLIHLDNSIYVWEGDNVSGAYASYNGRTGLSGGTGHLTKLIPPMQGFFVHANANNAGFSINNSHRVHSANNFLKSTKAIQNLVKLKVTKENLSTYTVINFNDEAGNEFDGKFDALQLFGMQSKRPQMYSITENHKLKLSINTLPLNSLAGTTVPLGIRSVDGGNSVIEAENISDIDSCHIYLEDKSLNKSINLRIQKKYEFNLAPEFVDDRFVLHFAKNNAPVLNNPFNGLSTNEDALFSYTVGNNVFVDPDLGDSVVYSAKMQNDQKLPKWLIFNPNGNNFTGIPGNQDVGSLNIQLVAKDILGATSVFNFVLEVQNINDPPVLNTPLGDVTTLEDEQFELKINNETFKDIDLNDNLKYNAVLADGSPLPAWLGFDPEQIEFKGVPGNENVGILMIKLEATDNSGEKVSDILTLRILNVNDAPIVQYTIEDQNFMVNSDFSFTIPSPLFKDPDINDELKISASLANESALPSWLNFDEPTGMFTGNPPQTGEYEIELKATDLSGATTSHIFKLSVYSTTDIEKIGDKMAKIYPNPSHGDFEIELKLSGISDQWRVSVKDLKGRQVYSGIMTGSRQKYNMTDLAPGKYIIELKNKDIRLVKSIIIK
ncbi:MAG: putative Ig domain-containing protein [Bacteroidales bacterium]